MKEIVKTLDWNGKELILIDQRYLPLKESYIHVKTVEDTFDAIKNMVVRGAPLIGFTALYGMLLLLKNNKKISLEEFQKGGRHLRKARPTAVNLEFEVKNSLLLAEEYYSKNSSLEGFDEILEKYNEKQMLLLKEKNLQMAKIAEKELDRIYGSEKKLRLMTLCNTGFLACGPVGTALGVISYLHSKGRIEYVYASETRPYLQGARLTAYELDVQNIPHSIIVEGAHSYVLKNNLVDAIFIGADRIVSNGDTANKIGSSTLSIVADYYNIPFYTVAPLSSFDFNKESGDEVTIELRPEEEILSYQGKRIAPTDSKALNPSFDITDHQLITGIISEKGLVRGKEENCLKPFMESMNGVSHA